MNLLQAGVDITAIALERDSESLLPPINKLKLRATFLAFLETL